MIISKVNVLFEKTVYVLFAIFITACTYLSLSNDASRKGFVIFGNDLYWYTFLAVFLAAAFCGMYLICLIINKYGVKNYTVSLAAILLIAFSARFIWINMFEVIPKYDFSLFYSYATQYAKGNFVGRDYISMFPHTFGYSFILSLIFRIFGTSVYAAQLFNVILGCGITALISFLGTRLFDVKIGLLAALLYAVWPSQIFYTVLVSTEELFTLIMLLCIYLFISAMKKTDRMFIRMGVISLICALMNGIRPFGILLIAAFFIVLVLKKHLLPALILAVAYVVFFNAISLGVSTIINKDVAKSPMGFNLFVGSDIKYMGRWNAEDSKVYTDLTKDSTFNAQEVHDKLAAMAFQRFKDQGTDNIRLFADKYKAMWSVDYDIISYVNTGLDASTKSAETFNKMRRYLTAVSNLYYLAMLLFCLIFAFWSIKKSSYKSMTIMLIVLGVTVIHLLMEVHGRYHYPVISLFALTAACGANVLFNIIKKNDIMLGDTPLPPTN